MPPQFTAPVSDDPVIVARTLWGEARGEGVAGIQAVASVIANRAAANRYRAKHGHDHPLYGAGTLAAACLANDGKVWQFTCWSPADPNRAKLLAVTVDNAIFAHCLEVAKQAIAGTLADTTGGAVNYLDPAATVRLYGHLPGWTQTMRRTASIGHHDFYADGPIIPPKGGAA